MAALGHFWETGTLSPVQEDAIETHIPNLNVSLVTPVGGYCVQGHIGVSLGTKELLDQTTNRWNPTSNLWSSRSHSQAIGSKDIPCDFVVVSSLTNYAILGATNHCAQIDLSRKQLKLNTPLSLTLG